jgi:hypothetical protein
MKTVKNVYGPGKHDIDDMDRVYEVALDGTEKPTRTLLHPGEVESYCDGRNNMRGPHESRFVARPYYLQD